MSRKVRGCSYASHIDPCATPVYRAHAHAQAHARTHAHAHAHACLCVPQGSDETFLGKLMEQHRDNPLLRQPTREQAAKTLSISTYYGCTTVALLTMALLTVALLAMAVLAMALLTMALLAMALLTMALFAMALLAMALLTMAILTMALLTMQARLAAGLSPGCEEAAGSWRFRSWFEADEGGETEQSNPGPIP